MKVISIIFFLSFVVLISAINPTGQIYTIQRGEGFNVTEINPNTGETSTVIAIPIPRHYYFNVLYFDSNTSIALGVYADGSIFVDVLNLVTQEIYYDSVLPDDYFWALAWMNSSNLNEAIVMRDDYTIQSVNLYNYQPSGTVNIALPNVDLPAANAPPSFTFADIPASSSATKQPFIVTIGQYEVGGFLSESRSFGKSKNPDPGLPCSYVDDGCAYLFISTYQGLTKSIELDWTIYANVMNIQFITTQSPSVFLYAAQYPTTYTLIILSINIQTGTTEIIQQYKYPGLFDLMDVVYSDYVAYLITVGTDSISLITQYHVLTNKFLTTTTLDIPTMTYYWINNQQ